MKNTLKIALLTLLGGFTLSKGMELPYVGIPVPAAGSQGESLAQRISNINSMLAANQENMNELENSFKRGAINGDQFESMIKHRLSIYEELETEKNELLAQQKAQRGASVGMPLPPVIKPAAKAPPVIYAPTPAVVYQLEPAVQPREEPVKKTPPLVPPREPVKPAEKPAPVQIAPVVAPILPAIKKPAEQPAPIIAPPAPNIPKAPPAPKGGFPAFKKPAEQPAPVQPAPVVAPVAVQAPQTPAYQVPQADIDRWKAMTKEKLSAERDRLNWKMGALAQARPLSNKPASDEEIQLNAEINAIDEIAKTKNFWVAGEKPVLSRTWLP